MGINIDIHGKMPINQLFRLVLKFIFDRDHCSEGTQFIIETNIDKWYRVVTEHENKLVDIFGNEIANAQEVGNKGTVIDEIHYQLMAMGYLLREDEKGELDHKKDFYKEHRIDYRKDKLWANIFPEMRPTQKDRARAQEYLRINNRENRELLN